VDLRHVALIIWPLSWAGVIGAYAASAAGGYLPDCVPHLTGCTSVSASGRYGAGYFIFKALMIPAGVFFAIYWMLCERWLAACGDTHLGWRRALLVVGIVGAGTIGLCAVAAAKAAGAAEITIMARHPTQEQAARALGATRVLHVDDTATEEEIADKLDGAPLPDVVIEAIGGAARSVNLALEFVRKGGSVSVVGVQWEHNEVELFRLVAQEVRLTGSAVYATPDGVSDFEEAMALMAQNPEVADTLITHDFALDDAREAFATAADRGSGSIKVMVAP